MSIDDRRDHALVIGGSIAGLVAARVLAARFHRVTVLERHAAPPPAGSIAPHGRYPHVLLDGGRRAFERLLPGFGDQLVAAGAPIATNDNGRWWSDGWRLPGLDDSARGPLASRALIEASVRERVAAIGNIQHSYGTRVCGLVIDGDRVRGVRTAGGEALADLVVDCGGRGSRLGDWLADAGYPRPPVTEIVVDLAYTAAVLPRHPGDLGDRMWTVVQNMAPRATRLGLAIAVEGDRWMVLLGGYFGDSPPTDLDGYTAFADSLPVRDLGDLLRCRSPVGEPLPYQFRSSRRVHVDRVRVPRGLAVLGDAMCSFNPLYGQGISVAALQAEQLGACLDHHPSSQRFARTIHRELTRVTDPAWRIAAGGDLAYPQVAGARTPVGRMLNRYMARVFRACTVDAHVSTALRNVTHLTAPPTRLLRPAMIARVLTASSRPAAGP